MATRYVVVGRHEFTERQKRLLERAGLSEQVARVAHVEDVSEVVNMAKERGASAIVVQALPLPMLAQLLAAASRAGIKVYGFKIIAVGLAKDESEAEELAKTHGADIMVMDPRNGTIRVSKTAALQLLKRVVVEAEDVATI